MITKNELKILLSKENNFVREALYSRGFIITNSINELNISDYPFYGNWRIKKLGSYTIYLHKYTTFYYYKSDNKVYFLVGHAYNPFKMIYSENEILTILSKTDNKQIIETINELTGNFILGCICDNDIYFMSDPTGMQISYYGKIGGTFYLTSHSKLVGDLNNLKRDEYVERLVSYKFYYLFGKILPGDLSPYKELKRTEPNFVFKYNNYEFLFKRIYPIASQTNKLINKIETEAEYNELIKKISEIMKNSMSLIQKKWSDKTVAISVTGGRDSLTTLAAANGLYDKYKYFSYISTEGEKVDAYAARDICKSIGLSTHEIYNIDLNPNNYSKINIYTKIMDVNAGCIGGNHQSDVQKRIYFLENPHFDIEVKSWVDEISRARYYKRYNKNKFSKYPTARNLTSIYKFFLHNRKLVNQTDIVFQEYLNKYYSSNEFDIIPWTDLFYWEFSWPSGEGLFLNSEHRVSYEITIPFNNRKLLDLMLSAPLEKRIGDKIQIDVTDLLNPEINKTGIHINDIFHTKNRAKLEGLYYSINSKLPF